VILRSCTSSPARASCSSPSSGGSPRGHVRRAPSRASSSWATRCCVSSPSSRASPTTSSGCRPSISRWGSGCACRCSSPASRCSRGRVAPPPSTRIRRRTVFERLLQVGRDVRERNDLRGLLDDCRQLLTARGESNSLVIAARALERYRRLSPEAAARFFDALAAEFDPDPAEVLRRAESYAMTRSPDALIELWRAAESPRQELLRRLNRAPDATAQIIAMRARILSRMQTHPELRAVDADFQHLLSSWFNPGFLNLVQVDWSSPANLLEKLIQHEAVHQIDGWSDLRRRLEPDRRCFAFFHPTLPGEPLIIVEVALLDAMPEAIAPLLERRRPSGDREDRYRVAAFYS